MKKIRFSVLLILIFHSQVFAGLSVSQIVEKCGPAVVTITAFDKEGLPVSYGSGFFLSREGDLVTNRHVLSGCRRAAVRTPKGKEGAILYVSKADPRLDLVVAKTSFRDTAPLILGHSDNLSVGEKVLCMGNSRSLPGALSLGEVSHIRDVGAHKLIQMTAPILPGCSGGPVFDSHGRVVGISTAFLNFAPNLNFALAADNLKCLTSVCMDLDELPEMKTRLEAVVQGQTVVDLWIGEKSPMATANGEIPGGALPSGRRDPGILKEGRNAPGTVYFKNGKRLLCDRAWKQGKVIYLLVHGKGFVLGYEQGRIEMKKSFVLPF